MSATLPAAPKTNRLGLAKADYEGGKSTLCLGCGHNFSFCLRGGLRFRLRRCFCGRRFVGRTLCLCFGGRRCFGFCLCRCLRFRLRGCFRLGLRR